MMDSGGDTFDALANNHEILVAAQVREVVLIAAACDAYTVDGSRADVAAERLVQGGADGTAMVGEFLALELAGILGVSPVSAALRVREVLNLRDRHPELWAFMVGGGVPPWKALKVATRCAEAGLSGEAARWVDHQVALVLPVVPWARALRSLEGLIVRADTALAAERARVRRERRGVWADDHADGGCLFVARVDSREGVALKAMIDRVASALALVGDTEPVAHRRATALGLLADPQAVLDLLKGSGEGVPTNRRATLVVHIAVDTAAQAGIAESGHREALTPAGDAGAASLGVGPGASTLQIAGIARVEGIGALELGSLRRFLAHDRVTVRPVIDVNLPPTVDAYEVPARLREHVLARNPFEAFPYSTRRSEGCDLDHTLPYDHHAPPGAGQTRAENLGPLSRRVHRAKTARVWQVTQPEPGVFRWVSPHGFRYEVSDRGTIALGRPDSRADAA